MTPPGPPYPVVRLSPKAEARAIRHGFPWAYAGEVVMDRRTSRLAPGSFAVLEDAERRPMGVATVNPASRIVARMMDPDPAAVIDAAWIEARLARALALRERLYDAPFYRLAHAEADGLPGVVIDRMGDLAVVQPNAAWAEALIEPLADALRRVTGVTRVVKSGASRGRALEGLPEEVAMLRGAAPDGPVPVRMNGATYLADVLGGQKTGLFYDQRENHAFLARLARGVRASVPGGVADGAPGGARVLDVFAHVGGFGLAALAAGAASVTCVDSSAAALALAERGAEATGGRVATRKGDAFAAMEALAAEGAAFDLVACDRPAFAPTRAALDAGLRAYERVARLAAPLVAAGGVLALCSCSGAADLASFRAACARGIGRAGRRGPLIHTGFAGPDHPVLPQLPEGGYLKALFFRL